MKKPEGFKKSEGRGRALNTAIRQVEPEAVFILVVTADSDGMSVYRQVQQEWMDTHSYKEQIDLGVAVMDTVARWLNEDVPGVEVITGITASDDEPFEGFRA